MKSASTVAVVGLCGNERTSTRGRGLRALDTPRPRFRTDPRPAPIGDLLDDRAGEDRREEVDRVARAREQRRRRPAGRAPTSGGRAPPSRRSSSAPGSRDRARPRTGACRGRRPPGAGSGCPARRVPVVARVEHRLAQLLHRGSGEGRSGLPNPRSITSSPARRSSSFSSLIAAKTYGGRLPTRRSSIRESPAGRDAPSPPRGGGLAGGNRGDPLRERLAVGAEQLDRVACLEGSLAATTPTPSRLAPPCEIARRAPASTPIRPRTGLPNRSQSLKADSLRSAAAKRVPLGSPARIGPSTRRRRRRRSRSGSRPPRPARRRAPCCASRPCRAGSSSPSSRLAPAAPSASSSAPGRPRRPRVDAVDLLRSTSSRARTRTATCAASASLSPKVISSVAVASFSLTTGTTPSAKSALSALRALT